MSTSNEHRAGASSPDGPPPHAVTQLLEALRHDDAGSTALDALFREVYDELQQLAHAQRRKLGGGDTMRTTALVHEAYRKLSRNASDAEWLDRTHFFAVAAKAMRHILINYARRKNAQKRGGEWTQIQLDDTPLGTVDRAQILLDLDDALDRLETIDARMAQVVELRFFTGLSQKEIADALGVSTRTVRRDWRAARAWLADALRD